MTRYRVYGLEVDSDIALAEPEVAAELPVDVTIIGRPAAPVVALDDAVHSIRFAAGERVLYEGVLSGPGVGTIQIPEHVSVALDDQTLQVHLDPTCDAGWAGIFAGGLALSFHLAVHGSLVLHASAVELDGRAIAMTAPSGCGKSTLAALVAVNGHPLVADDVLRVAQDGSKVNVFRGSSEIRLREGATALAANWPDASRTTVDGRSAVAPPRTEHDRLPLGAIVTPLLDRERSDVELERIPAGDALLLMMQCLRLVGWTDPQIVQREFEQLSDLVAIVPVIAARIPWRTPAEPWIAALMLEQVSAHLS